MKILYLNPIGQIGGAERSLLSAMAGVRAAEPSWDLQLLAGDEGPLTAAAAAMGVRISVLRFPAPLAQLGDGAAGGPAGNMFGVGTLCARLMAASAISMPYLREFARRLRQARPHVVHSNGFKTHLLAAAACPPKSALLWHVHDYVSMRPFMSRALKMFKRRCAVAVANSHSVARDVGAVCEDRPAVRTIHNAVDTNLFSPDGPALDLDKLSDLPPAPAGAIRIGLLATFARWKGHRVFLEAVSRLAGGAPIRAYVIGAPLYATGGSQFSTAELKKTAEELGIEVGFPGFVRDVPAALRSLDIAVHASTAAEPFGLAILEAMSCGRAVVFSRAGGALEICEDGREALSHEPGNVAELASAMKRLVSDAALRNQLGIEARRRATSFFSSATLDQKWIAVYREALALREQCGSCISTAETSTAG